VTKNRTKRKDLEGAGLEYLRRFGLIPNSSPIPYGTEKSQHIREKDENNGFTREKIGRFAKSHVNAEKRTLPFGKSTYP